MSSAQTGTDSGFCPMAIERATLADPQIRAHPNDFYRAIRAQDPVHYDPQLNMYLVSRYEDLLTVLRDPIAFSVKHGFDAQHASGFAEEFRAILERDGVGPMDPTITSDPPEHTRIRKLMENAFTAHRVKQLEPRITAIVVELIELFADKGQVDGVNDFAVPLTIRVICEQLGVSQFDAEKIQRWSTAATAQIGRMQTREQMLEHAKHICEFQRYLKARIEERQADPGEDMISDLIRARLVDGSTLTFPELMSLVGAMLITGNETTATALGNLMFILATQPAIAGQLQDSVDDERLLTRFVEELLRIEPPVRGLSRMTTKDVELGGKVLPAGAHLLLLYAAANDDDAEFACPRAFDLNRGNLSRHLSFGGGVHRCIGAALARMEIKVAARELVKRLENIRLTIPLDEIAYLPTIATRSIARLPLTFSRKAGGR